MKHHKYFGRRVFIFGAERKAYRFKWGTIVGQDNDYYIILLDEIGPWGEPRRAYAKDYQVWFME